MASRPSGRPGGDGEGNMSVYTERFQGIMEQYSEALEKAGKTRRLAGGLFGLGGGPGDDPCHDAMDKQVGELAEQFLADEDALEEAALLVSDILKAEKSREWTPAAKWAVLAIQRYTIPLIPEIGPEDRKELAAWYTDAYPKRQRLPIQKQIVKELEKEK